MIIRLNTDESANVETFVKNNYSKNFSDGKRQNSKKNFLKNFIEKEKFDFENNKKKCGFLDKIKKNSSVKNIFSLKKLNFFENDVRFFYYLLIN